MKPSDKQLAAGTLAFNECDIVSTPHCISAAYDAMTEVMTVVGVPERVRREIQAEALLEAAQMLQCHKPHHKLSKIEMLCVYAEQLREQNK